MAISNTRILAIPTRIFLATGQTAITTMMFCNVTTSATSTVSVFAVPLGGNAGETTQILNNIVLPPGESFSLDKERFVIDLGDAFYAQASDDNQITATVSAVSTE
jgi:hypothetical protein